MEKQMTQFKKIKAEDLHFDYKNPRLVEFGFTEQSTDEEIITILWDAMDAREVAMSIVASGYFQNDPLLVAIEQGKKIVIEGNRRLAAIKALLHPGAYEDLLNNIPESSSKITENLKEIPAIIQSREEAWKFLGFKHVNGPAKWGSYAKAKYIADVHRSYKIPLEQIGKQIGDTHKTVQRLFHGLRVIEQAEEERVFDRNDVKKSSFYFSHMYVGLQREGIKSFLNIIDPGEETKNPVPNDRIKELGELCLWLYGSKKDDVEPVVQSQNPNLKELDNVLQKRQALAALRSGESLQTALVLTQPSSSIFENELLSAKRSLVKARGVLTQGYDNSEELLRIAGSIANLAADLYDEMERKRKPKKIKRLTEE